MAEEAPARGAGRGALTSSAMTGLRWTGTSLVVFVVLQLLYQAVVSRVLAPSAFGVMAIATVAVQFSTNFADVGLGRALIQKQEIDDDDIRATFTSSVLTGAVCFAGLWLLAPFIARLVSQPESADILRWTGLVLLCTTFGTTSESLLRRDLRFKSVAIRQIGSYAIGFLLVGITLALAGAGIWSLVAARVTAAFTGALLAYSAARHSLRPLLAWRRLRPLYSFGGRSSISNIAEYVSHNLDTLVVSRYTTSAAVGQYSKAYLLTSYPTQLMVRAMSQVLFPGFSQIQDDRRRVARVFLGSYVIAAFILLAVCLGMAVASDELVLVLLGAQWGDAARVLPVMLVAAAFRVTAHFTGIVFDALDELNTKLAIQAVGIAVLLGLLVLASGHGLLAYAAALAASEALRQLLYFAAMRRILDLRVRELLVAHVPAVVGAVTVTAAVLAGRSAMLALGAPVALTLLVEAVMGAVGLLVAFRMPGVGPVRTELAGRLRKAGLLGRKGRLGRVLRALLGVAPTP